MEYRYDREDEFGVIVESYKSKKACEDKVYQRAFENPTTTFGYRDRKTHERTTVTYCGGAYRSATAKI